MNKDLFFQLMDLMSWGDGDAHETHSDSSLSEGYHTFTSTIKDPNGHYVRTTSLTIPEEWVEQLEQLHEPEIIADYKEEDENPKTVTTGTDSDEIFGIAARIDEPQRKDYATDDDFEVDYGKWIRAVEAIKACDWMNGKQITLPSEEPVDVKCVEDDCLNDHMTVDEILQSVEKLLEKHGF